MEVKHITLTTLIFGFVKYLVISQITLVHTFQSKKGRSKKGVSLDDNGLFPDDGSFAEETESATVGDTPKNKWAGDMPTSPALTITLKKKTRETISPKAEEEATAVALPSQPPPPPPPPALKTPRTRQAYDAPQAAPATEEEMYTFNISKDAAWKGSNFFESNPFAGSPFGDGFGFPEAEAAGALPGGAGEVRAAPSYAFTSFEVAGNSWG